MSTPLLRSSEKGEDDRNFHMSYTISVYFDTLGSDSNKTGNALIWTLGESGDTRSKTRER